jgi:hypothetical protein
MQGSVWLWVRIVGLAVAGMLVGLLTFDSMRTGFLKAVAGACIAGAVGLLFFLDRKRQAKHLVALGCGALVFLALVLLWFDTPDSSDSLLLIGLLVAAAIAWGVLRI